MKMRNQNRAVVFAAATAAVAAMAGTHLSAAEVYWQGGAGNITATNYTSDGVNTIPYTPGDIVNLGANGSITVSTAINYSATTPNAPGSVHVGHNFGTLPGPATLTVAGSGSSLVLVGNPPATNPFDRAALVVGYNADGSYVSTTTSHMDGLAILGGDNPDDAVTGTGTGTLTVNGGNFRVRKSDFIIGYGNRGVLNHGAGHLMVGMHNQAGVSDAAYDMYVGYTTASEWNKTFRGNHFIGNSLFIGSGSLVNLASGRIYTKHKSIDNGYATDAPEGDVVVGRNGSDNDRLNISYNGTPTSGNDLGPTEVKVGNRFLLASGGGGATTSTVNQSDGTTVIVARNLSVSDTGNTSTATYNLSGGTLTANADLSRIGRRGSGTMIQTGGTATFNAGLAVGDDDSTDPGETDNATGLYEISAGTLTTNLAGDALRIGSAGNGTLRVVGQDGAVTVNGNLTSSNTSDGAGNLAYKFESGESLSTVNVTGTATFTFNSGLAIDSSAIPTPASGTTYNLVSAADVTDNGLLLTDWGWTHQVVPGGAGELLQAVKTTPQYWDTDGTTPGAGGAAPSGAWNGTAANFSTDSTGSSATGATTGVLDDVVFAAGSDGAGSYTVTVSGTQTAHAVQFARGDVLLSGGTLAVGHFDAVSGATGTVSSNIAGDAFGRVIKSGAGTITLASANSYAGGTTVSGGTLIAAHADALGTGALTILSGATARAEAGLPKALSLASVSTTGTGKLDLTDNKLVVSAGDIGVASHGTYSGLTGQVQSAYNAGGWNGSGGITTSMPDAATGLTTLAVATAAQVGLQTFGGVSVGGTDVLIFYTYGGDTNFDGKLDADDYGTIDFNVLLPGPVDGYYNGDFNYDGVVNADDYGVIDFNILAQTTPFPTGGSGGAAAANAVTAVPEPGVAGTMLLVPVARLFRRRRRPARAC